jgi:anti-anti-sigma factor
VLSHPLLEVELHGEDTRARLACRALDWETSLAVGEELARLVRRPGRHDLRLDLGGIRFLTAAGLSLLVVARNELRARGGRLVLCNVGPVAHEIFRAVRLDRLLDIRTGADNRLSVADSIAGERPSIPPPPCWA